MKKALSLVLSLAMILVLFAGCGNGSSNSEDSTKEAAPAADAAADAAEEITEAAEEASAAGKDTLVVCLNSEPTHLNSINQPEGVVYLVWPQVYETLMKFDADGELICGLAESYDLIDDTTISFKLREGVRFHNGDELKASDVLWTFTQCAANSELAPCTGQMDIENSYCEGDYTFVLKLKNTYAPIFNVLTLGQLSIHSQAYDEANADAVDRNPCGTGPYRFVSWDPGVGLSFTSFEDYWDADNIAKIPNLEFKIITDSSSRTIALETGTVDIIFDVPSTDMDLLAEEDGVTTSIGTSNSVTYLIMGNGGGKFDDTNVRLALVKAIDRESLVTALYQGKYATVANSTIAESIWGYDGSYGEENYGYDPDAAKELLAEAGYGDGISIDIMITDDAITTSMAEMIANMWNQIGINATVSVYEAGTYYDYFGSGDYDVTLATLSNNIGDPDDTLFVLFHPELGMGLFVADDLTAALEKQRAEMDEDARLDALKEVQDISASYVGIIPLLSKSILVAYNSDLQNLPAADRLEKWFSFNTLSW